MSVAPSMPPLRSTENVYQPCPQHFWPFHSDLTQSKNKSSSSGTLLGLSAPLWAQHSLTQAPFPSPSPSQNPLSRGPLVCVCVCVHAKSLQLCSTLCNSMDCSPPGSSVHGILQARMLEWVAMPPPEDLPDPGIKPPSLMSPALAGGSLSLALPGKPGDHLNLSLR